MSKSHTLIAACALILLMALASVLIILGQSGRNWPSANVMPSNVNRPYANAMAPANRMAGNTAAATQGPVVNIRGVKIDFVSVPAGNFQMGSDKYDDEKPMHRVTISKRFFMGRYEITQAQWQAIMGSNPSMFRGNSLPVENVSWNDAQSFIQRLNQLNDGFNYRLPTEAEWEYACRAGTTGEYAGDLDSMAWDGLNSGQRTHQVGVKESNAFGLYDMHGNVWEWCEDWYDKNYYQNSPSVDPQGPSRGRERVTRGGSWVENANGPRSAGRSSQPPDYHTYGIVGFRVVAVRSQ